MRKSRTGVKRSKASLLAPRVCEQCGCVTLKRKVATYPVPLTGKLAGRRIDVYRVELDKCTQCGFLMPTPEGNAKVQRCIKIGIEIFLKNLP